MFVGLHVMLADRTDTPEIAISEEEGKAFMDAAQNVMRHYSVETTQKTLDWLALIGTGSAMYMPRIAAIGMRKRASKGPRQPRQTGAANPAAQPGPATVVPIMPDMQGNAGFTGEGD